MSGAPVVLVLKDGTIVPWHDAHDALGSPGDLRRAVGHAIAELGGYIRIGGRVIPAHAVSYADIAPA